MRTENVRLFAGAKKIRVLLVDDHAIVRQGLRALLETAPDMEVVGEAENGWQAVAEATRLRPDVILLDLAMPLLNGLEAARRIVREVPASKVLILSNYSDDRRVQQAIEARVAGYVLKQTASDHVLQAIRAVREGYVFFSPSIPRRLLKKSRKHATNSKTAALTSRQAEVLQLVAEGYSNKEIANVLSVSEKTAEKHRQLLMDKLDIHNVASLTRYAVSIGAMESNRIPNWPVTPNGAPTDDSDRPKVDSGRLWAGLQPKYCSVPSAREAMCLAEHESG